MSCASRRVSARFILGCGSSSENASISGLRPNFLAITSNGGASATCPRWSGSMAWHGTQRACARRLPLSASAASAAGASRIAGSSKQNRSDRIIPDARILSPRSNRTYHTVFSRAVLIGQNGLFQQRVAAIGAIENAEVLLNGLGTRSCIPPARLDEGRGCAHLLSTRLSSTVAAAKRRYKSRCLASGHQSYKKISIGFQFATQPRMMSAREASAKPYPFDLDQESRPVFPIHLLSKRTDVST
jgi:hypothetical protein